MYHTGIFILVLWLTAALFPCQAVAGNGHDSLVLTRTDIRLNIEDFFVADIDGDGQSEFIEFTADRRVIMVRQFIREGLIGPALYQANFDFELCSASLLDVDSLPGTEIMVVILDNTGDSLWMEIYDGSDNSHVLCRTEAVKGKNISNGYSHLNPGWDAGAHSYQVVDLDGDGDLEIVMPLMVGFDLYPRGIYVYDYPSGKLLWKFPLAGNPAGISLNDADGDGKLEIYVKTWACFNGAQVDDRMDTTAYAFAIAHDGREIWRQNLGDRFDFQTGEVRLCDCDDDDTLEIYYTVLMASDKYDAHVRVLQKHRAADNLFLKQRSFDADQDYRDIYTANLTGDGDEVLIVNSGPTILNPVSLEVAKRGPLKNINIQLIADIDCDLSNGVEIVATKQDSLYILDGDLNIIFAYQTEYGAQIRHVKHFQSPFGRDYLGLLVQMVNEGVSNSVLYSMQVQKVKSRSGLLAIWRAYRLFWPTVVIAFMLGMPIGIILYRATIRRHVDGSRDTARYEPLLSILASFNHGQMAGKNLNRLAFLFGNLPETETQLKDIRTNIEAAVSAYGTFTRNQLAEIVRHTMKFKELRPYGEQLNKADLNLREALQGFTITNLDAGGAASLREKIPIIVDNVKKPIKEVKSIIEKQFSTNLSDVFYQVFSLTSIRSKEQNVLLNLNLGKLNIQKLVFFAERELITILEELISNSIAAMETSEQRIININLMFGNDEAILEVMDTGHGLQEQDLDRVFNRDFSTKKEGGFGLYYARQQCEKFGAGIAIFNNQNAPGAAVRITLKAVGDG